MAMNITLAKEIEHLLNAYSIENMSDTPDFVLAGYLMDCLESWNKSVKARELWYGREIKIRNEKQGDSDPPVEVSEIA
jgi:uncharacterized protein YlzI (FlbEa/FlbD family)